MRLRISTRADADLESIWRYIARDNPGAAVRVEEGLHDAMRTLTEFPGMGHTRSDVANPAYRFWTVAPYVIAYRVEGETLIVVRVLHGARNFRDRLR
jgi:plasmid stabilization system protein ParE